MAPKKPVKSWSMYLNRHHEIATLLEDELLFFTFHNTDDEQRFIEAYNTNIMGRFICRNQNCTGQGWASKRIAIRIRLFPGQKYNARVYHQRCKACNYLCPPILNETYAERVAYRLKKWSGVEMERPNYKKKNGKPHEKRLCEGCKYGHCSEA